MLLVLYERVILVLKTVATIVIGNLILMRLLNQGHSLLQSGETDSDYPHQYNDYEGFDFPVSGPWYEYPILSSFQVYTGGSPGADRIIFNDNGEFAT